MNDIEKALERMQEIGVQKTPDQVRESGPAATTVVRKPSKQREQQAEKPVHMLNLPAMEKAGFIVPNSIRSSVVEEYRILKRPILMNAFGRGAVPVENGNLVMITSTAPGEGKTFTATNLAMSMAIELDTTALLIDADVIRPTLTGIFNLRHEPGLVDLLLDEELQPSDVIVKTDLQGLSILPAGRGHLHSTELLSSARMRRLALDLARHYNDRIIIMDSPPLLAATESRVLSDLAGQVMVVVEAGKTSQSAIKEALEAMDRRKPVGMVLNKSSHMFRKGYYYGSYGKTR